MKIKKIIREEIEDFQWINDIEPEEIEFRPGDQVIVYNLGREDSFLNWLGLSRTPYSSGRYGKNITGTVVKTYTNSDGVLREFLLEEKNTKHHIFFPYKSKQEGLNGLIGYVGLNIMYEPISY